VLPPHERTIGSPHERTIGSLAGAGAGFNPENVLYCIVLYCFLLHSTAQNTLLNVSCRRQLLMTEVYDDYVAL
jgi:hypothetical protein